MKPPTVSSDIVTFLVSSKVGDSLVKYVSKRGLVLYIDESLRGKGEFAKYVEVQEGNMNGSDAPC
jgi:hypothetical protein